MQQESEGRLGTLAVGGGGRCGGAERQCKHNTLPVRRTNEGVIAPHCTSSPVRVQRMRNAPVLAAAPSEAAAVPRRLPHGAALFALALGAFACMCPAELLMYRTRNLTTLKR